MPDMKYYLDCKNLGDRYVTFENFGDGYQEKLPKKVIDISKIITVRHFELPARYVDNPGEWHDTYEIIYVEKGIFLDVSEDEPIEMHSGDIVFYSPGYYHRTVCDGEHSAAVFITSFECDSPIMKETFGDGKRIHLKVTTEQRAIIAAAFSAAVKAYKINSHFCEVKIKQSFIDRQIFINYIETLCLSVIKTLRADTVKAKVFFARDTSYSEVTNSVLNYLEERVYSNVTIDDICRALGYSRGHLCNRFKEDTGRSIKQYFQLLKIEEAKKLILETGLDIGSISETLGYSNPQYFSKSFRRFTGHTPGHFRKTIFKGSLENE